MIKNIILAKIFPQDVHMCTIILCFVILVLFIMNNSVVISGASCGLMLWYNNVVPVLLPFMLLSNIMVSRTGRHTNKTSYAIIITLFLGIFCGYPLGAKTASDFVKRGNISKLTGNILIPLCNNSSPMFIAGYIVHILLNDQITFPFAMLAIYIPYLTFVVLALLIYEIAQDKYTKYYNDTSFKFHRHIKHSTENISASNEPDIIMDSVTQITYVGIYIMICSIIIEFIKYIPGLPLDKLALLSGITEITNGTHIVSTCNAFSEQIKTALVMAFTSFGGISAILQTNKVISHSGLSILSYIIIKTICAVGTFYITLLLI